ncbi:MAG: DUF2252 family protein [Candidatus Acidiferrales bacterium]
MINIHQATESFERWKSSHIPVVKKDLEIKHSAMAAGIFPFFRATFYRWLQLWEDVCPEEARAPKVLAVGDLHVENFGTWRDLEGRLIWGVNDFDEAYRMPYTIDLVRLATSVRLAMQEEHLSLKSRSGCDSILEGYCEALETGCRPFVLGENNKWLRRIALSRLRDPVRFWGRMEALPAYTGKIPDDVRRLLEDDLPEPELPYIRKRRVAGLGSLGHLRVVALAKWRGAWIAREIKALAPSACVWAGGDRKNSKIHYQEIIGAAARVPDPFLRITEGYLLRRLAPDCSRILLASLPEDRDETRLVRAMGFETANIHFGSPKSFRAVIRDLERRPDGWLHRAAKRMAKATRRDWKQWCDG